MPPSSSSSSSSLSSSSVSRQRLGQMINVPAILYLGKILMSPSILRPHISADSINNIDIKYLRSIGIKYIVFDKDNTISRPYENQVHAPFLGKVEEFKAVFGSGCVAVLSNSAGSSDDIGFNEARAVEEATGLPVIRHTLKKPGCVLDVFSFFAKSFELSSNKPVVDNNTINSNSNSSNNSNSSSNSNSSIKVISPGEVCVIGDRLLTDTVFANANGMHSILVPPISTVNDNQLAVVIRHFERGVILPLTSWLFRRRANE